MIPFRVWGGLQVGRRQAILEPLASRPESGDSAAALGGLVS